MDHETICPECGSPLPSDAQEGLCPQCLMKFGRRPWLGWQVSGDSDSAKDNSSEPSPAPEEFALPDMAALQAQFPRLEILELLGRGGMGVVYKARQKDLDRFVALKILPGEVARDSSFAERFNREAKALARLNHPRIVTIYDFGVTEAGQYYLVMEYVDGANLRAIIRGGELAPAQALALVPQICEALQFAHDEGIVHRDIKPANILLDKKGRVKIADFGLAKLMHRAPDVHSLTANGQTMGTPQYMAPEQLEKPESVDHRADIYSLGVVFYEMLTGELPLGRFMPPSQKVQVDVRLDEVVLKTLEKEPARRYQHASEVKSEVEHISSGQAGHPVSPAQTPTRPTTPPLLWSGIIGPPAAILWVLYLALLYYSPRKDIVLILGISLLCGSGGVYWALRSKEVTWERALTAMLAVIFALAVGLWSVYLIILWQSPYMIRYVDGFMPGICLSLFTGFAYWILRSKKGPRERAWNALMLLCLLVWGGVDLLTRFLPPPGSGYSWVSPVAALVTTGVIVLCAEKLRQIRVEKMTQEQQAKFVQRHVRYRNIVVAVFLVLGIFSAFYVASLKPKSEGPASPPATGDTEPADTSGQGSGSSTIELKHYPVDSLDGVIAKTGLALDKGISSDGNGSIRITADGPTTVQLYETGDLDVEDVLLTYQARMRTENVEGKAYLEMWRQFPGGVEAFSKDLESALSGSTLWCTEMTPCFLKKGENPVNVKLNVAIEGKGTVWIDDIRLSKGPLPAM